ncbi:TIGR04295 family B12-binding domain-containing radical SAM protein [Fodinicurvata sp. EGI_FJ10296]|uniref:TIGR04295 family B12-binding domain-containing radical SAM protein n=1 Tax=Fodinicurvata sp. EGI_FJ10296 TaxID=3231908 RepID=UPI003456ADC6
MRIALVNPAWRYDNSIYFGCRAAHLPLELGYSRALSEQGGHTAEIFDGQLSGGDNSALAEAVAAFQPDMTVVATAPTYLFWRCAPPELRVPGQFLGLLGGRGGLTVAVGPHGSVTPEPTLRKLGCDIVVRGECEEVVAGLANHGGNPGAVPGTAWLGGDRRLRLNGGNAASPFVSHPALKWPDRWLADHWHHHHRFDAAPDGPGAEVEASRGCPFNCSFCAKIDYRDKYRRRDLSILLDEIDALIAQGVTYLYFIDEIFLPRQDLLAALTERDVRFGVQTRIDLWRPEMIALLGKAGCVSVEAGLESLTPEGRDSLDKRCRLSTEEMADLLIEARRHIPFVQANLIATVADDPATVACWRDRLRDHDVWANDPVPLFAYPSSPDYRKRWGAPDDCAWERAHDHYLREFGVFSDIQEQDPKSLAQLEAPCPGC